jgi:endonuclease/exonuclease/phosphatase (EEP) superfamily protein YafD
MIYKPGGIGPRRTWGTIVAARKPIELVKAEFKVNAFDEAEWASPAPGSVESVDIVLEGETWATVVGAYAFMPNSKNGFEALEGILCEVIDVFASGRERMIVAGDFNLWPNDLNRYMNDLPLIYTIGTIDGIPELVDGKGGSRIWTHKNGNSPNAARQEIDYIYVSEALADEFVSGCGGIDDYPTSWEFSDHAPVMAQFNVD